LNGSKALFFSISKTFRSLFFDYHYARFLWRAVFVLFGINPPKNTNHLFNSWSKLGGSNHNYLLLTGAMTFCWTIWKNIFTGSFQGNTLDTILGSVATLG
jgi:hypothetical protein